MVMYKVVPAAGGLSDLFGVDEATKHFILQSYVPAARAGLARVRLSLVTRLQLMADTLRTTSKLVFAFLYQVLVLDYGIADYLN